MIRKLAIIASAALLLAGCDVPDRGVPASRPGFGANGRRDLTDSDAETSGQKGGQTYAAFDGYRDQNGTGLAFAGYGCVSDCADVIDGYRKARKRKVTDARLCEAAAWGEVEGCVAYTQRLPSELSSLPPLKEEVAR